MHVFSTSIQTPITTDRSSPSRRLPERWRTPCSRLAAGAAQAIDLGAAGRAGQHPHVGVLDVAPVVYLRPEDRGAACAEALVIAERIGSELEIPVFLYGELTAAGAWGRCVPGPICAAAGSPASPADGRRRGGGAEARPRFRPARAASHRGGDPGRGAAAPRRLQPPTRSACGPARTHGGSRRWCARGGRGTARAPSHRHRAHRWRGSGLDERRAAL